jgi:hypothetical protein
MALETGGHLSLGHRTEIRARVAAFLREHAGGDMDRETSAGRH